MSRVTRLSPVLGLLAVCWISASGLSQAGQSKVQMEMAGLKYAPQHFAMTFHEKPEIGQFAIKKNMMGKKTTWCVVGGKAGAWEVEERRQSFMDPKGVIVILRIVDDKGNVSRACCAEFKKDSVVTGEELKVTKKPEPKKGEKPKEKPKPKYKEEEGPEVAGLKTRKITMKAGGKDVVTCMSKKALFAIYLETPSKLGGAVKSTYDGKVTIELEKQGTDKKAYTRSVKMPAKK